jgi:uncharacterized protein (DUF1697 family)
MKTYIALFRGINVGGKHALPMKELMAILEGLGAQTIKTYIQSGNVVFTSQEQDPLQLSKKIRAEIKQRRGFEPHVLLLEPTDLERVMKQNPFPEAETDPKGLHVSFLLSAPTNPNLKALEGLKKESERFELINTVFYLHAPEGVGRSKLAANAEKLLGAPMTDRNWRTVCALWDIAQALR